MISRLAISGYRSIRSLILTLGALNVVTGPNGCGKSNLYRGLRLLADAARGGLGRSLAREGGLPSVLWAGPEVISREMLLGAVPVQGTLRKKPVSLRLGFRAEPYSYCLDIGLPAPGQSLFGADPEIKRECLYRGLSLEARDMCADRRQVLLRCRGERGGWQDVALPLTSQVSMLSDFADPFLAPEVVLTREVMRSWRFYDSFRTDIDAPARRLLPGTFTPVMSDDGGDLAAAIQTIFEIGDAPALAAAVDEAFPGAEVHVVNGDHGMELVFRQPGLLRSLSVAELSDGTLRFLLLAAALLTPRPPSLMVLNEPEASLHPDLLAALSRLVRQAQRETQVIVVSHSAKLVELLEEDEDCVSIRLVKRLGETVLDGGDALSQHGWSWPAR
ncbi:MAG: AAA family ATPase [Planctomycetales bacterium]|nr:AAA family ATPase [Planctomycetales bacterium]